MTFSGTTKYSPEKTFYRNLSIPPRIVMLIAFFVEGRQDEQVFPGRAREYFLTWEGFALMLNNPQ
jgi:hypothetical protein